MRTYNPQNERIKRTFFTYLAEAKGFSEATLDPVAGLRRSNGRWITSTVVSKLSPAITLGTTIPTQTY
jgi:hypothetical protein